MTARRATILRREEAEREVASREEKRREDGFPVNRPRRLARAQTRPAFRVRRRHHPHLGVDSSSLCDDDDDDFVCVRAKRRARKL